ncbi:hypothetical protein BDZ97DRAFT_1918775 [Flammula alnicola]|nr:hypothetical protein BDZ97DRAFT_1918775 [Flammula alnicola]
MASICAKSKRIFVSLHIFFIYAVLSGLSVAKWTMEALLWILSLAGLGPNDIADGVPNDQHPIETNPTSEVYPNPPPQHGVGREVQNWNEDNLARIINILDDVSTEWSGMLFGSDDSITSADPFLPPGLSQNGHSHASYAIIENSMESVNAPPIRPRITLAKFDTGTKEFTLRYRSSVPEFVPSSHSRDISVSENIARDLYPAFWTPAPKVSVTIATPVKRSRRDRRTHSANFLCSNTESLGDRNVLQPVQN